MDETIKRLQSILADSMHTLPLLLSGLIFFLGTLTANTGMLLMIVSIVLGVNGLGFILNLKPFTQQDYSSIFQVVLGLGSIATFRASVPYFKGEEGSTKDVVLGLSTAMYIIHAVYMLFFKEKILSVQTDASGQCSMLGKQEEFSNPSTWLISVTYILGFVFANALNVFNIDSPVVSEDAFKGEANSATRKKRVAEQQKLVNDRVMNRKLQTFMIMFISLLVLSFVIWYRINLTKCEQSLPTLIAPLSFVFLVSFFLYSYIVLDCGIRPADILGITYDMVHPDLINNPIVCVTS
jgi:hypothetical protein